MKKEISCGAVIARQTDAGCEVLLVCHASGGHWGFPKGHVENNETEAETALREIREETGLSVTLDTNFRTGGDEKIPVEEITGIRWAAPDDAAALITYDNDRDVLARYRAYKGV